MPLHFQFAVPHVPVVKVDIMQPCEGCAGSSSLPGNTHASVGQLDRPPGFELGLVGVQIPPEAL